MQDKSLVRTRATTSMQNQFKPARRSGTSLNHQIFLVLRDQISAGNYPSGTALPSENQLSEEFHVSRITVRAALANLESSGLVDRRHGIGTFVKEHITPTQIHAPMVDLLAHIANVNSSTQVKLREVGFVKAPPHVQLLFNCGPNQMFQRAVRVRSTKGVPIFHIMTLVPEQIARQFTRKELAGASMYQLLRNKGYQFKSGNQLISAALAVPSVAKDLNVEVGAPLLQVRRIHFDALMRPFEYMEYLASPAQFEIQMTLGAQDLPS
jgi:GntR family transcriptional regulator